MFILYLIQQGLRYRSQTRLLSSDDAKVYRSCTHVGYGLAARGGGTRQTGRGWVVVPLTCCPDDHDYGDGGWSVSSVWCACNDRHMEWRCHCGAALYAPQPVPHCRLRESRYGKTNNTAHPTKASEVLLVVITWLAGPPWLGTVFRLDAVGCARRRSGSGAVADR